MGEYIVVETVNAIAAGRFMALVKGERVSLSSDEADDLLRAGYVEVAHAKGNATTHVETAAHTPAETATAPAQRAGKRKV
jgi:hypothetical protein